MPQVHKNLKHESGAIVEQTSIVKTRSFSYAPEPLNEVVTPLKTTRHTMWPDFLAGQPDKPIRVLLIDDDPHIRGVIAHELLGDPRIDLVGQGASMRDGRRLTSQLQFDVMLVDFNLGDGCGLELVKSVKVSRPAAEAVVISATDDDAHVLRAFQLGATGYLVKNFWFGNIAQAVLQVVNGGACISPSLARRLLTRLQRPEPGGPALAREMHNKLSGREKEILSMVASGFTSVQIGPHLRISYQTVNTHIKNIYKKLQVRSRAQAVAFAARQGLL